VNRKRLNILAALILICGFLFILWLACNAVVGPSRVGPVSLGDVLNADVYFPVYSVNPDSEEYGSLHTTYYFLQGQSDADHITTSFTIGVKDKEKEAAHLRICSLCSPPLGPGGIGLALEDQVEIRWASDELDGAWTFQSCLGETYKSCLFWIDVQDYSYRLYTIWSPEKAVEFANALIKVKRGVTRCC
jgi:hypothetical protein